jgi:glycosyltransferase involved in cell wall biosynthesis
LLIEAMRYVSSPVRCIFAGSSSDQARYESLIKRHQVGDRVELLDFVDEQKMIQLYANALGVCYLPFDEDYGYVTLEAMISARPVIVTTDSGGPKEFVEDRSTGFVVEPEPKQIAAAIDQLHKDRVRSQTMGKRGQEKTKAMNLSWSNVVERLISAAT